MSALVLSLYCLVAPLLSLGVVAAASFVGARLSSGEFSWGRYAGWLAGAFLGAVLMLAARTELVFLSVAVGLVLWVLLRAAADAQSTTLREKVGFVQLYAGLFLVEYGAMRRAGMLHGTMASPPFAFALNDYLGHLVFPISGAFAGAHALDVPASAVGYVGQSLAQHWLFAVALSTFGVAALAYAYFAEHATPQTGVALLPAPTAMAVAVALLGVIAVFIPSTSVVGFYAAFGAVFLAPFFVAEGIWVLYRFATRLQTRALWAALLALFAVVSPLFSAVLGVVGWTFHLIRFRAFEPILGGGRRSSSRPRLRTAAAIAVAGSAVFLLLGVADGAALRRVSPGITAGPEVCGQATFTPAADGVTVASPSGVFTIDVEETPMGDARPSIEAAAAACERRHARLCTSDEWYLACLCTYPNESVGGTKTSVNDRLVYRVDDDRAGGTNEPIRGLLTGKSEVVTPASPGGGVLLAGPNDAIAEPYTTDCRYRAFLTERALRSGAGELIAARCCR